MPMPPDQRALLKIKLRGQHVGGGDLVLERINSTDGLDGDDGPNNTRISTQKALLSNGCRVLNIDSNVGNHDRWQSHLNVSDPERCATAFEDFFCGCVLQAVHNSY